MKKKRTIFAAHTHRNSDTSLRYIGGDEVNKLKERQSVIVVTISAPDEHSLKKARDKFFARKDLGHIPESHRCCYEFGYWQGVKDALKS